MNEIDPKVEILTSYIDSALTRGETQFTISREWIKANVELRGEVGVGVLAALAKRYDYHVGLSQSERGLRVNYSEDETPQSAYGWGV